MNNLIVPIILSGGEGMRLWPISRASYPKQLIKLPDGSSMLENTLVRLSKIEQLDDPIIICGNNYKFVVAEKLRKVGKANSLIIVEPFARDTAPAVSAGVLKLIELEKNNRTCIVIPADHNIDKVLAFETALVEGIEYANQGYLVVFGISPTHPETGYGYIQRGNKLIHRGNSSVVFVKRFIEKPDFETAITYLNSKDYFWNSGITMFKSNTIIQELNCFIPELLKSCRSAVNKGTIKNGFFHLNREAFLECPKISIDCAIMEKTVNSVMIPMRDIGWKDLGSWSAYIDICKKDSNGNVIEGDVVVYDVRDSYLHSDSRLITAVGIEQQFVIETADAVLVGPLSRAQDIRHLVNKMVHAERKEVRTYEKEYLSWGNYEVMFVSDVISIAMVIIAPGKCFCLNEYFELGGNWIVINGKAIVNINESKLI